MNYKIKINSKFKINNKYNLNKYSKLFKSNKMKFWAKKIYKANEIFIVSMRKHLIHWRKLKWPYCLFIKIVPCIKRNDTLTCLVWCIKRKYVQISCIGTKYSNSHSSHYNINFVSLSQGDKIWRNFATFAKSWVNFRGLIYYLAKFWAYFGKFSLM